MNDAYKYSVRSRIKQNSKTDKKTGCWVWQPSIRLDGYGQIRLTYDGKAFTKGAHKTSYIVFIGDMPEGMFCCHTCDNKLCVNPEHLYAGTQQTNMEDMRNRGRAGSGNKSGNNYRGRRVLADHVEYESTQAASMALSVTRAAIYVRIKKGHPGYKYLDPDNVRQHIVPPAHALGNTACRKVRMDTIEYESVAAASRDLNISKASVRGRIKRGWPGCCYIV